MCEPVRTWGRVTHKDILCPWRGRENMAEEQSQDLGVGVGNSRDNYMLCYTQVRALKHGMGHLSRRPQESGFNRSPALCLLSYPRGQPPRKFWARLVPLPPCRSFLQMPQAQRCPSCAVLGLDTSYPPVSQERKRGQKGKGGITRNFRVGQGWQWERKSQSRAH